MEGLDKGLFAQGFYMHGLSIWIRHPKPSSATSSISSRRCQIQNTPNLILFFSWTSALPRPISKYTTDYIEMFPETPIMVITTTLSDLAFRSEKAKQSALSPGVDYIISRHLDSHIHTHCLSEGGSHKAIQFAKAYLSRTGSRLPLTSLCLDSTPGDHQYHRIARAFKLSLPPTILFRTLGLLFAYLMLTFLWAFYAIYGPKKNLMTRIRRGLEDQRLWDTQNIRRCYLYSEKDTLIKYQDVERHARKAQKKGVRVWTVRFQKSEHCHHIKEDKERYWEGVRWTLRGRERSQKVGNVEKEMEMDVNTKKEMEVSVLTTPVPIVLTREITPPEPVARRDSRL